MENTYKKIVLLLTGISTSLLLIVLLFYESYKNPVVLGRYSIRYLIVVASVIALYLASIAFLKNTHLWRKESFRNILFSIQVLTILILLGEIIFRAASGFGFTRGSEFERMRRNQTGANAQFTYCGQPSVQREFGYINHKTNSLGFNDDEHSLEKKSGTYRILVVGDSYVEAMQVERDSAFHQLIEAKLNANGRKTEVIAMGRSSQGTIAELKILEDYGLRFKPDLVILGFLPINDISDNSPALKERYNLLGMPFIPVRMKLFLRERSDLLFFLTDRIDRLRSSKERMSFFLEVFDLRKIENDPIWQQAWRNTYGALLKMKKRCEENDAELLVVSFTSELEIASYVHPNKSRNLLEEKYRLGELAEHYDFKLPDRLLSNFCRNNGIVLLQLNALFADLKKKNGSDLRFHYFYDGHWNPRGHAAAANAVMNFLDQMN